MTEELKAVRLGKITASQVYKLLGKDDNKFTQAGETYLWQIVGEIMTGCTSDEVYSKATEWGNTYEPVAFKEYVKRFDRKDAIYFGEEPQFFTLKEFEGFAGASPDGMDEGAPIEIKCPYNSAVHAQNLCLKTPAEFAALHPDYYAQMQMQMMCVGCDYGKFISFDPRNKVRSMKVLEVPADIELQQKINYKIILAKQWIKEKMEVALAV